MTTRHHSSNKRKLVGGIDIDSYVQEVLLSSRDSKLPQELPVAYPGFRPAGPYALPEQVGCGQLHPKTAMMEVLRRNRSVLDQLGVYREATKVLTSKPFQLFCLDAFWWLFLDHCSGVDLATLRRQRETGALQAQQQARLGLTVGHASDRPESREGHHLVGTGAAGLESALDDDSETVLRKSYSAKRRNFCKRHAADDNNRYLPLHLYDTSDTESVSTNASTITGGMFGRQVRIKEATLRREQRARAKRAHDEAEDEERRQNLRCGGKSPYSSGGGSTTPGAQQQQQSRSTKPPPTFHSLAEQQRSNRNNKSTQESSSEKGKHKKDQDDEEEYRLSLARRGTHATPPVIFRDSEWRRNTIHLALSAAPAARSVEELEDALADDILSDIAHQQLETQRLQEEADAKKNQRQKSIYDADDEDEDALLKLQQQQQQQKRQKKKMGGDDDDGPMEVADAGDVFFPSSFGSNMVPSSPPPDALASTGRRNTKQQEPDNNNSSSNSLHVSLLPPVEHESVQHHHGAHHDGGSRRESTKQRAEQKKLTAAQQNKQTALSFLSSSASMVFSVSGPHGGAGGASLSQQPSAAFTSRDFGQINPTAGDFASQQQQQQKSASFSSSPQQQQQQQQQAPSRAGSGVFSETGNSSTDSDDEVLKNNNKGRVLRSVSPAGSTSSSVPSVASSVRTVDDMLRIQHFGPSQPQHNLYNLGAELRRQIVAREQHVLFSRMSENYVLATQVKNQEASRLQDDLVRVMPDIVSQFFYYVFYQSIPCLREELIATREFQCAMFRSISFWLFGVERESLNPMRWRVHDLLNDGLYQRKKARTDVEPTASPGPAQHRRLAVTKSFARRIQTYSGEMEKLKKEKERQLEHLTRRRHRPAHRRSTAAAAAAGSKTASSVAVVAPVSQSKLSALPQSKESKEQQEEQQQQQQKSPTGGGGGDGGSKSVQFRSAGSFAQEEVEIQMAQSITSEPVVVEQNNKDSSTPSSSRPTSVEKKKKKPTKPVTLGHFAAPRHVTRKSIDEVKLLQEERDARRKRFDDDGNSLSESSDDDHDAGAPPPTITTGLTKRPPNLKIEIVQSASNSNNSGGFDNAFGTFMASSPANVDKSGSGLFNSTLQTTTTTAATDGRKMSGSGNRPRVVSMVMDDAVRERIEKDREVFEIELKRSFQHKKRLGLPEEDLRSGSKKSMIESSLGEGDALMAGRAGGGGGGGTLSGSELKERAMSIRTGAGLQRKKSSRAMSISIDERERLAGTGLSQFSQEVLEEKARDREREERQKQEQQQQRQNPASPTAGGASSSSSSSFSAPAKPNSSHTSAGGFLTKGAGRTSSSARTASSSNSNVQLSRHIIDIKEKLDARVKSVPWYGRANQRVDLSENSGTLSQANFLLTEVSPMMQRFATSRAHVSNAHTFGTVPAEKKKKQHGASQANALVRSPTLSPSVFFSEHDTRFTHYPVRPPTELPGGALKHMKWTIIATESARKAELQRQAHEMSAGANAKEKTNKMGVPI